MTENGLALPFELTALHDRYAVYRCYSDTGQLLYIGSTGGGKSRFMDHAQKAWFLEVRGITFEWYADELDARNAERRAIHVEHPKYNIMHRTGPLKPQAPRTGSRPPQRRSPGLTPELLAEARRAMADYRREYGKDISAEKLRLRMGIHKRRACEILREIRGISQ